MVSAFDHSPLVRIDEQQIGFNYFEDPQDHPPELNLSNQAASELLKNSHHLADRP